MQKLKAEGKATAVGFAAHCATEDQVKIIKTDKMDYVNLHFGFFSCYHNVDTQPAVLAAAERDMGICEYTCSHRLLRSCR